MRGEWIEIARSRLAACGPLSLPMRGEWIEIETVFFCIEYSPVSPHAGRVD